MIRSWLYRSGVGFALAALTLFLGASTALAQASRIEGTVRNAQSGDPIAGARVTVVGTDLAASTNANGYYAIENVPVGTYSVRVSVIGFQPVTITNQTVSAGIPTTVNFQLQASILRIEGVVVTGVAERTEVVKLPFTVDQISGEDMPVPPMSAEESIRGKVAGAKVVRGEGTPGESAVSVLLRGATSISTSGRSNEPLYVVDGVILGEQSMVDIDALEIESIEVVKGAAAAALYGARAANGVVSITTRRGRDIPEGETRIVFRSEFGRNNLENPIPQGQSHWHKTDATGWLGRVTRSAADPRCAPTKKACTIDSTVAPDDRAKATRPIAQGGADWRPYDDLVTDSTDFDGDGKFTKHTYLIRDNAYPGTTYDNLERFFDPGSFYNNSMSISHRTGNTNFLASFHESKESGIVEGLDGYVRRGARLNVDHKLGGDFDLAASVYYTNSQRDEGDARGASPFYGLNFYPIDVDLLEREAAAQARIDAGIGSTRDSNDYLIKPDALVVEQNPIYSVRNVDDQFKRSRVLGNVRLRWRPVGGFDIESDFSFDRSDENQKTYWFKGFKTIGSDIVNRGRLYQAHDADQAINWSLTSAYNGQWGDFGAIIKARVLLERATSNFFDALAQDLAVDQVQNLDIGDQTLNRVSSSVTEIRSLGYFLSTQFDYNDRYIVDALIRRDGSSLFGPEERWQWYYRISGAWRMAQEPWWPIAFLDEFKPRFSQGTAGGRPGFSAQYETYSVSGGLVSKQNLGNKFLKPEFATEREFGLDMLLGGRLSASLNYVKSTVEDQILQVPLSAPFGFGNQWRNAGTLEGTTYEATLQWAVFQNPTFAWNMNFVIDRTKQTITEFNLPAFRTGPASLFYVRRNEPFGTMYGDRWAKDCREIYNAPTKTFLYRSGDPNACLVANGGNYEVNDDGYLVAVGSGNSYQDGINKNYYGSKITIDGNTYDWGMPIKAWDTSTNPATGLVDTSTFLPMGNSLPDFNWGWANTLRYKNLQFYMLFDAQVGGDIYNNTRQWAAREGNAWETDQVAKAEGDKKPLLYYQVLYNINANNSHYVEDGSYIKLRELSLRYTFNRSTLEPLFGNFIKRVSLNLIGRNLITWTDYTGYDPEVSTDNDAGAYYRVDAFEYPNFRTITGSIEIEF